MSSIHNVVHDVETEKKEPRVLCEDSRAGVIKFPSEPRSSIVRAIFPRARTHLRASTSLPQSLLTLTSIAQA